ncbi:hypothetical protein [Paenibacillus pinihumi]|nr:hypothetical protein [Paenibacillus pinihumi]
MSRALPVNRIGTAEDVAESVLSLIRNEFNTGSVLHVDGGHSIV